MPLAGTNKASEVWAKLSIYGLKRLLPRDFTFPYNPSNLLGEVWIGQRSLEARVGSSAAASTATE